MSPILPNFPRPMQLPCSLDVVETKEASMIALTAGCSAHLAGMAASGLESWIGLEPVRHPEKFEFLQYIYFLKEINLCVSLP